MNQLDQLKNMTQVVTDTGNIDAIATFKPQDATTNPTLILKACTLPQYQDLIFSAVDWARQQGGNLAEKISWAMKKLLVNFGVSILTIIPGRISTEIDARLSFDTSGSIRQAQELIELYRQAGISRERILIKIAATWEGIQAATELERQGIHCNLTLIFDIIQAVACANAGISLVSPFVGRIYDWYQQRGSENFLSGQDPGVLSVQKIYTYLQHFSYPTRVMGASFRHIEQIRALAGCDFLTISPPLLTELQQATGILPRRLDPQIAKQTAVEKIQVDEESFRWQMNENSMATEKLAEGIRLFSEDHNKLAAQLSSSISA